MRIFDRYIARQVLLGTLYAVAVLGLVLVLGDLFKRIQPLLVDQKAPPELVLRFVISILPLSLMYTIPWGFLSAVLLVFGKLSTNHEITAFRVGGLSLTRLAMPVFALGIALSVLSAWINGNVVPRSKATSKQLFYEQAARDVDSLLKPGRIQGDFKGDGDSVQKLLIEGKNGQWVEGFHFYVMPNEANGAMTYVHAAKAALAVNRERSQLSVKLQDAYFESRDLEGNVDVAFAGYAEPLLINLKDPRNTLRRQDAMTNEEIRDELATNPKLSEKKRKEMRMEVARRYSFSVACIAFAFIAVPLGLQSRRRETSTGLTTSLLIGVSYFLLIMMADQIKTESTAKVMLWAPNVACVLLGLVLFRRARFK